MILENEDFQTITATNGEEALQKAYSEVPDLILLDIVMPGMDGLEVCKILKEKPRTKSIPVLMFTVLGEWENIEKSKKAGADSHIIKPFTPKNLVDEVKKHLSKH